jgi:flagellar basal body rod protein FlgG
MLSGNKKSIKIPKKVIIFASVISVIVLIAFAVSSFLSSRLADSQSGGEVTVGVAATKDKTTGFDGAGSNDKDPDAIKAYCDDVVQAAKRSEGVSAIRDMCLLNSITKEFIPYLTNEQIQEMAESRPSCLETGYDNEGYNCFTGFGEDGCSREGIDETGAECRAKPNLRNDPMSALATTIPENICSIVNECQSENAFGPDGFNEFGCNRQGKKADGTTCPAEYITRIYDKNNRDQLGFDPDGFNKLQCDAQGIKKDGTSCPTEDITRVFNKDNMDQWGFNPDYFNHKFCSIEGLNEDGLVCDLNDITHKFNSETGLDQFGLDKDLFNTNQCNLEGFNKQGELCSLDNITRIFGKDGLDQFGLRKNGRNKFNCDLSGKKPNNDFCLSEEITRIINPSTGKDQLGFFSNGLNDNDCDFKGMKPNNTLCSIQDMTRLIDNNTGRDNNNLDVLGFNLVRCNAQGKKQDGSLCNVEDIPRIFSDSEFDQFGIDIDGFNDKSCNLAGVNRAGKACDYSDIPKIFGDDGLNHLKLDKDGFNIKNCNLEGIGRDNKICAFEDIPKILDNNLIDQFGLNAKGYSVKTGCNLLGFKENGTKCDYDDIPKIYDKIGGSLGLNQFSLDENDRNKSGCDLRDFKEDGTACSKDEKNIWYDNEDFNTKHKDKDGFGRLNLNELGFNKFNCDINGLTPQGKICEIDKITRIFDKDTGKDQFGLDKSGFNEFNCNLEGKDRNNNACLSKHIPRIFDADLKDQFGVDINSLPDEVWEAQIEKMQGLSALLDSNEIPLFYKGKAVFVGSDGTLRNADGTVLVGPNGENLKLNNEGEIVSYSGIKIPSSVFSDKNGEAVSGELTSALTSFRKLTDSTGEGLQIDGEDIFVDRQGNLRKSNGSYVLDEDGNRLVLGEDGEIIDSNGEAVSIASLLRKNGAKPNGKLYSVVPKPNASKDKMSVLLNGQGQPVFYNGEAVLVDVDGVLRKEDGTIIIGPDGELMKINGNGEIVSSSGTKMPASAFTSENGGVETGTFTTSSADFKSLVDSTGSKLQINGEDAFVDSQGKLRKADGSYILDEKGNHLALGSNGEIVNLDGESVSLPSLLRKDGSKPKGSLRSVSPNFDPDADKTSLLLNSEGAPVFYNGEKVFVGEDGLLINKDGMLFKGPDGKSLKINSKGEIVSLSGLKIPSSAFTKDKFSNDTGVFNTVKSEFKKLADSSGAQLQIKGENVFVDNNGELRKSDGSYFLDKNGNRLVLSDNGEIVDALGNEVSIPSLKTKDGRKAKGTFSAISLDTKTGAMSALINAAGQPLYIDGKAVMVDKDGYLREIDGRAITDKNGNRIKLNDRGQIVNDDGEVLPSTLFKNSQGIGSRGALGKSPKGMTKSEIEARALSDNLSLSKRLQLGLGEDGFNAVGCGLHGMTRLGKVCDFDDIPKNYDPETGLDQLGFGQDKFNSFGCDFNGKNRSNEQCEDRYITKIQGIDGYDQFDVSSSGLKRIGLNAEGENASGCDAKGTGLGCTDLNTPQLTDAAGVDQFNKRFNKSGRLGLTNGFNSQGCGIAGTNKLGELCSFEDIPRFLNGAGVDQFGIGENNLNRFDCGLDGLKKDKSVCDIQQIPRIFDVNDMDQFGLSSSGFNSKGCSLSGFKEDGSRCLFDDIPKIYDGDGFDQLGFSEDGYNANNCDYDGIDRFGKLCSLENITRVIDPVTELDQLGLDIDGFNNFNCNLNGKDRSGKLCDPSSITRVFDPNTGLDQFSFFKDGYNASNCDYYGYDRNGVLCESKNLTQVFGDDNKDQFGVDKVTGLNKNGCGLDGLRADKSTCKPLFKIRFKNKNGRDQYGLINGRNLNGCGVDGLNESGEICNMSDITKIVDSNTGLDQFDLDANNKNKFGCGVDGLKEDGTVCLRKNMPKIYDIKGFDQFGLNKSDFNSEDCNLFGQKSDGTSCDRNLTPRIVGDNGYDSNNLDLLGFQENGKNLAGFYSDGCNDRNQKEDGTFCPKYQSLDLNQKDEEYMKGRKLLAEKYLSELSIAPKPIGAGSYAQASDPLLVDMSDQPQAAASTLPITVREALSQNSGGEIEGTSEKTTGGVNGIIEIPLGYMTQVYVKTPVNSDYRQDVYATIIFGELDSATLIGKIVVPYLDNPVMPRDKFYYEFTQMIYNRVTYPISAVSLNVSNDSGMVSTEDVNYHYVQRYGGLIVATAVQALDATFLDSQAERDLESQSLITEGAIAANKILLGESSRELSKQNLKIATKQISDLAQEQFTRRPTITNGTGSHLIIFKSQVEDDRLPVTFAGIE